MDTRWFFGGVALALVIGIAVFASGITGFAIADGKEKVKIGDIKLIHNAPLYLALEKGYFKEAGIDVEVVKFDAPKQIVDAVVLNQVDLGGTGSATGISAIAESLQPGSLKYYAFSCYTGETGYYLVVQNDSEITSFKDLSGKKIGQLPGPQWRTLIRRMLKVNGIDPQSVQLVDLAPQLQVQALQGKQIDALVALDPVGTMVIENGIGKAVESGVTQKYIAPHFCAGTGIISTKFLQEKPATAAKVLAVMKKAIKEYMDLPTSKKAQLLVKHVGIKPEVAEKVPQEDLYFPIYDEILPEDKADVQTFLDVFYEDGIIQKRVLVEDVLLKAS